MTRGSFKDKTGLAYKNMIKSNTRTAAQGNKAAKLAQERAIKVLHNSKVKGKSDKGNRKKISRNITSFSKYNLPRGITIGVHKNGTASYKCHISNIFRSKCTKDLTEIIMIYAKMKLKLKHFTKAEYIEYLKCINHLNEYTTLEQAIEIKSKGIV